MRRVAWLLAAALAACVDHRAPAEVRRAALIDLDGGTFVDDPVFGPTAGTRVLSVSTNGTSTFALVAGGTTPATCGTLDSVGRFRPLVAQGTFGKVFAGPSGVLLLTTDIAGSDGRILNLDCTPRPGTALDGGARDAIAFDDGWLLRQSQGSGVTTVNTAFLWADGGLTPWRSLVLGAQAVVMRSGQSALIAATAPTTFGLVWVDPHDGSTVGMAAVARGPSTSAATLNTASDLVALSWSEGGQQRVVRFTLAAAQIDSAPLQLDDFARPIEGPRLGFMHYDGRAVFLTVDGGVSAPAPFGPRFAVDGGLSVLPYGLKRFDVPGRFCLVSTNSAWSVPIDDAFNVTGPAVPVLEELSSQDSASLARLGDGRVLATWQDTRNGEAAIYARVFDAAGRRLGPPTRLGEDVGAGVGRPGGTLAVAGVLGGVYDEQARLFMRFSVRPDHTVEFRGASPVAFGGGSYVVGASGPGSGWLVSREFDFGSPGFYYFIAAVPVLADAGVGPAWRSPASTPSYEVVAFSVADRHYFVSRELRAVAADGGFATVFADDVYVADGYGTPAFVRRFDGMTMIGASAQHVWLIDVYDGGYKAWDVDAGGLSAIAIDDRADSGGYAFGYGSTVNSAGDGERLYLSAQRVSGEGLWITASLDAGVVIEPENLGPLPLLLTGPAQFTTATTEYRVPKRVRISGFDRSVAADAGGGPDAGGLPDAGWVPDAGVDAGVTVDPDDAEVPAVAQTLNVACGCSASSSSLWVALAYTLLNIAGRRRRVTPCSHARTSDPGSSVARRSERQ